MSKKSAYEDKMLDLQFQMKQNNEDLKSFLQDLDKWEAEMKQIDSTLKDKKPTEEQKLPPVRNSLEQKKFKKKVKKKAEDTKSKPKRISSYDYRSWDKFDVDKACESVDRDHASSGEEYETDEEWENERKRQAAVLEKDKGNEYFKKGDYANAIECYTKGADLDPTNPLLPANRAMALLKQEKYGAAELDCSVALTLDPLYTKAYLRRGSARLGLKKYREAKADFEKVLQLEPQNKKARSDLDFIERELARESLVTHSDTSSIQPGSSVSPSLGVVKAISKHPSQRSHKSLRRIDIEEVGLEEGDFRSAVAKTEATQSKLKRDIMEREADEFQRFTAHSPADIAALSARTAESGGLINGETFLDNQHSVKDNQIARKDDTKPPNSEDSSVPAEAVSHTSTKSAENIVHSVADKNISKGSVSPREIQVPVNSVQFQTDYRRLKSHKEAFCSYFQKIPPCEYSKLFGQFLDADVLQIVLTTIRDCYIPAGVECVECLQSLSKVKRFSMVVMFMSKKEKQVLTDIFSSLKHSGKYTDEELNSLAAKYEIR